ncbi:MAG: hypothetical protein EXS31_19255 [Pedosphaera sp.]|nr:hypothetical protein [Pedosphaera sp.]
MNFLWLRPGAFDSFLRDMRLIATISIFSVLLGSLLPATNAAAPASAKGVTVQEFRGWPDSLVLEASGVHAIVAPAVGGRILQYGVSGENILYEDPKSFGKILANYQSGFSVGGYQCDIGPELRGIPDHEALWVGLHQWKILKDFTVRVTSEKDVSVGVQLEKQILIEPGSGDLGITQEMRNISDKEVAHCLWDRTLCKNDGFAFFPLNRKSRFKAGWSLRRTVNGKFIYDGDKPAAANVRILKGMLVARCEGPATKVGADCAAGWIAYVRGRLLLVKYFPFFAEGNYTDGGNSVELYYDERVAELEPLSPEVRLQPGGSYMFPEKWTLIELEKEVLTFEKAAELVKRIPPSPFGRK